MGAGHTTIDPHAAINSANRVFVDAFARKDAKTLANLYTKDGKLLPPGSDFISGKVAIEHFWQEAMNRGTRKLETIELEVHGEVANEVGRYRVEAADGRSIDAGKYLVVWKREEESWRMHLDIWSSGDKTSSLSS